MVDAVGGDGGNGAAGRGGGSSALARDGETSFVLSGDAGGSPVGGSDAAVGDLEGVDPDMHVGSVHELVVQHPHVEMEVNFTFSPLFVLFVFL